MMKTGTRILIECIYYFLIVFISYTAMNKFLGIHSFQLNLLKTGVFDARSVVFVSYSVIITELLVLLLLIFKRSIGSLLLLLMLTVFTIYISLLRYHGRYEVCGCGGLLNGLQFKYHLFINLALIGMSFAVYRYRPLKK